MTDFNTSFSLNFGEAQLSDLAERNRLQELEIEEMKAMFAKEFQEEIAEELADYVYIRPVDEPSDMDTTAEEDNAEESNNEPVRFKGLHKQGVIHENGINLEDPGGGGDDGDMISQFPASPSKQQDSILTETTDNDYRFQVWGRTEQTNKDDLLEIYKRHNDKLKQEVDKKEDELQQMKRKLLTEDAELLSMKQDLKHARLLLNDSERQIEMLKQDKFMLLNRIDNLEKKLQDLEDSLVLKGNTIQDLQKTIHLLEKGVAGKSEKEQLMTNIKNIKEKYDRELDELKLINKDFKNKLEQNEMERKQLRFQLEESADKSLRQMENKNETIDRLTNKLAQLQECYAKSLSNDVLTDNVKLQTQNKCLKEQNRDLRTKLDNLMIDYEQQGKDLLRVNSWNKVDSNEGTDSIKDKFQNTLSFITLKNEHFSALKRIQSLKDDVNHFKSKLTDCELVIKNKTEKEREHLQELQQLKVSNNNLNKEIHDINSENKNKLKVLTEQHDSENEKLRKNQLDLEFDVNNKQQNIIALTSEVERYKTELLSVTKNLEVEKVDLKRRHNEEFLKFHEQTIDKVRKEMEDSFCQRIKLKDDEISNLQQELFEAKELYIQVCHDIEKSKKCIRRDEVDKTIDEIEKCKCRINEIDQVIQNKQLLLECNCKNKNFDTKTVQVDDVELNVLKTENVNLVRELDNLKFCHKQELKKLKEDFKNKEKRLELKVEEIKNKHEKLFFKRELHEIQVQTNNVSLYEKNTSPIKPSLCHKYTSPLKTVCCNKKYSELELMDILQKIAVLHESESQELKKKFTDILTFIDYKVKFESMQQGVELKNKLEEIKQKMTSEWCERVEILTQSNNKLQTDLKTITSKCNKYKSMAVAYKSGMEEMEEFVKRTCGEIDAIVDEEAEKKLKKMLKSKTNRIVTGKQKQGNSKK